MYGNLSGPGMTALRERSANAPDIPTFAESGLRNFDVGAWTGLFVPAGTPQAIVDRLNKETVRIASDPAYVEQIRKMGTDVASSSADAFRSFVAKDVQNWTEAIQRSGTQTQ